MPSSSEGNVQHATSAARAASDSKADCVLGAITSRRSVRAFLPTPVERATVERILAAAARAPSGTNMQPWRVHVVTGSAKARLSAAVLHAAATEPDRHRGEYAYYPAVFPEPYLTRRRVVGWGLYGLLGIKKGEHERMRAQHARNFVFFDAPVGMIFTIDRVLERGSWIDFGMFLENIMIAARGFGLHTCPQAAFAPYHQAIRPELGIPEDQVVVCGMSLGYEDTTAPENALRTEREPLERFVEFHPD
jgi:nitroreductase